MSDAAFHYPPDLFGLLVETIPVLCRAKADVVLFFRNAGVPTPMTADLEGRIRADRASINKYEIARTVLTRINEGGDALLSTRRELLKRVAEFEDFTRCYDSDAMKAKGLVGEVRRVVNVKDSFTRMSQERDREAEARRSEYEGRLAATRQRRERVEAVKALLFTLFGEANPQRRGKALEGVLNDLFRTYDVLVAEDFKRTDDVAGVMEQIDGVVEIDHHMYLVEMKWWDKPLGPSDVSQHLSRLMLRMNVSGIFISSSDYTPAALEMCRDFLQQRVLILCTLREVVDVLNRDDDLVKMLRAKVRAAKLDRNPFKEVTA
ncbi:restriction endonuclease [Roseomonas sp. KE2513]|uniref:restriction endonuclease n=1 Tax=Roseomonas sp. KE2513 TaxID=2479202 RepID=UPI0018DF7015|nr:restriction endonuclease [Roseomonas sp. KE2513]MBI0539129.1 restriction endonuclease [Roseomonas sp. KE2513]